MDAPPTPQKSAPPRRLRAVVLVALVLGTAWLGRELVVRTVLAAARDWALRLGELEASNVLELEDVEQAGDNQDGEPPGGAELEGEPAPPSGDQTSSPNSVSRSAWGAPRTVDLRASADQVLSWANAGVVPRGTRVPARGACPAGIQLRGVGVYGLGLEDGDLLVRVEGVPVSDRSQVVSAVLAGRGRMKPTLDAVVVRPRTGCRLSFHLVLEQPYLTEEQLRRALPPAPDDPREEADQALTPAPPPVERAVSKAPR